MKDVKIYGASDDLIEIDGDITGADEYTAYGGDNLHVGTIHFYDLENGEVLNIHALYDGCWSFAVSPWHNDEQMPGWEMVRSFGEDVPYSETVKLSVPDDVFCKFKRTKADSD